MRAQHVTQVPRYFVTKREQFLQYVAEKGWDMFQAQDWLEKYGLYESSFDIFSRISQSPHYVNVLRPIQTILPPGGQPPTAGPPLQ